MPTHSSANPQPPWRAVWPLAHVIISDGDNCPGLPPEVPPLHRGSLQPLASLRRGARLYLVLPLAVGG